MGRVKARVGVVGKSFWNIEDSATAAFHNSVFRGKDITEYYEDGSLYARISGSAPYTLFEDLFIGDYIRATKQGVTQIYVIVDFDYFYQTGANPVCNSHHAVFMPLYNLDLTGYVGSVLVSGESVTGFKWNTSNSTTGGYIASRIRTAIMPLCDNLVVDIFGSGNLLNPDLLLPTSFASNSGVATGWGWSGNGSTFALRYCDLPNETQIYGAQVWGFGNDGKPGYEVGIDKRQFAYFRLYNTTGAQRASWWLRSVGSASYAAPVTNDGNANNYGASSVFGVRPRFLVT